MLQMGLVKEEEEKSIILHMNIISITTNSSIHNIFIKYLNEEEIRTVGSPLCTLNLEIFLIVFSFTCFLKSVMQKNNPTNIYNNYK